MIERTTRFSTGRGAASGCSKDHDVTFAAAAEFAASHETKWPRDLRAHLEAGIFEPPPDNEILGPVAARGRRTG
jgi:hypothetical protein